MQDANEEQGGWKGWLLMAACCIPMIAIIILVALGYWGFGQGRDLSENGPGQRSSFSIMSGLP